MKKNILIPGLKLRISKLKRIVYQKLEGRRHYFSKEKLSLTHITYCLAENAGDTVLSQCVRKFLGFYRWNIKGVKQKVDDNLLTEINQYDALLIGGGGLFLPDTNANSVSGWQWAVSNSQIERIKVPIILYSVGYNYFKGQMNTELFISSLNCIIRKAAFVGLRNKGSIAAVQALISEDLRDKIAYQPCTTTLIRKIYKIPRCKRKKSVAVNLAFDRKERRYGENQAIILTQVAKSISYIAQKGYAILYVAHCYSDLEFLQYLDAEKINYQVKNFSQSLPYEIIRFYAGIEIVIGMRGHAQMIPFGTGTKIISLGTHDKMKWFLEDVNLEDCYVDLNTDVNTISGRIIKIFTKVVLEFPKEMEIRMKNQQEKLWNISCNNREQIIRIIKEQE